MRSLHFHHPAVRTALGILALGAWGLSAWSSTSNAYSWSIALEPWGQQLANAVFFAATLLFFRSISREEPTREAETLLGALVLGGMAVLSLVLVSLLLEHTGKDNDLGYFMTDVWPALLALPVVAYLCWAFVRMRGLIDERTRATRSGWHYFFLLVLASSATAIGPWPTWAMWPFAGLAGIMAFSLVLRVKWIAELRPTGRLFTLFYLLLMVWVHGVLLLKFIQDPIPDVFHKEPLLNGYPLVLVGFNSAYVLVSLLALLFNWPISAVIERRARDLEGFERLLERSATGQLDETELHNHLFEVAMQRSGATAGFRSRPLRRRHRVQHLREGDVHTDEISRWEKALSENGFTKPLEEQAYIYVRDTRRHPGLRAMSDRFRTALAFRLEVAKEDEGFLVLLHRHQDAFDERTIRVLHNLVKQSLLTEENYRLVNRAIEAQRMEGEMVIAKRVQENLLPQEMPQVPWATLAVHYRPAMQVGGDFYDVFAEGEDRLHVVLGDVTGHGLGAAFNVAELKGIFHSNTEYLGKPVQLMRRVNHAVSACFPIGVFVTMAYFDIEPKENRFTVARAGHCYPLHFHADTGEAEWIKPGFLGLGMERSKDYDQMVRVSEHRFNSNDVLVIYTDGIIEAEAPRNMQSTEVVLDASGEPIDPDLPNMYGEERLVEVVKHSAYFDVHRIRENILQSVQDFQQGGPVNDDLTLLVIKFT